MNTMVWAVLPYLALVVLVGGTVWRHRYDKFGWTTRSSQLYESRLLRIGSPLFHYGLLFVIAGHVVGLLIPQSWTDAAGIGEHSYHVAATALGLVAALMTITGIVLLIRRRRTVGPVFSATTRNDKLMYVFLAGTILAGTAATLWNTVGPHEHNYRETIAPWFRSLSYLRPNTELMAEAPTTYQVHVVLAMLLFALFPFTRLVHAFSAPLGYLFRPYVVYRSRDSRSPGATQPRHGWERVDR
ncbi:respiratory nitrate reductase subunit gamma [Embleya sp. NPDC001921]